MESNQVSSSLAQLTHALGLGSSTGSDWQQFLNCLVDITQASSGQLKFTEAALDFHVENNAPKNNTEYLTWAVVPGLCHVVLHFDNDTSVRWAQNFWLQLAEQIQEITKLGMHWQERHEMQDMTSTFSQSVKVGMADISCSGELEGQNGIVETLIGSGVLTLTNGRIQLTEDPCWIENTQLKMSDSAIEHQSSHRIIKSGGVLYRCMLVYQKNVMNGWKVVKHQFSLLFYENVEQYNPSCLKSLFAISASEAKVIACFSEGLSAEEVSIKTGYKVSTIYSYIKELYKNLGINKQSQLTAAIWPELPLFSAG